MKKLTLIGALLILSGALLYQFGLRVVLDGGGMPGLRFVESADEQAARIERHRAEQRAMYAARGDSAPGETLPPAPASASPSAPSGGTGETTEAAAAGGGEPGSAAASTAPEQTYWTDFRGPRRDGHYQQRPVLIDWPAQGLTPLWTQPVGGGYASFVMAGGRAFTIEQRGSSEVVAAYDVSTGLELWTDSWPTYFRESMGGDGPRATPTWADGRVFALGAEGELRAFDDRSGEVLWRTNILENAGTGNLEWAMSGAPLVVDELVIVQPGGRNGQSVAAYDVRTGTREWAALDDRQSYASPMLLTLGGIRQLVLFTAARLVGLDLGTRTVLWEFPWPGPNGINAAQPLLVGEDRIFISSGYGMGAAVVEITRSPSEDVFAVREIWRNNRMKNRFASSVVYDGHIYGLDESILACVDAETGELVWKGGRYGYGQLLLADGHLIVLTEDGDLALVQATPSGHEELVRFPVLAGKTWNVPAIDNGFLLVRNLAEMAAFDLREPGLRTGTGTRVSDTDPVRKAGSR